MQNKHIVVLSDAGISAESGIQTFRDADGLWEGHNVFEVASIDGWNSNRKKVLDFYNQRRRQLLDVAPNRAHYFIAELQERFEVSVITQNVDDLHERAGSEKVIHLHGDLRKGQSEINANVVVEIDYNDIQIGDLAPDSHQLRPAIVWFGEMVPLIEIASQIVMKSDYLIVIGTSLAVYPAASLIHYASSACKKFIIDPNFPEIEKNPDWDHIQQTATDGVEELKMKLFNYNGKIKERRKNLIEQHILPYFHLEKRFPLLPGKKNKNAEALILGLNEEELLLGRKNAENNVKQAALELLKEQEIIELIEKLPFDGTETIVGFGGSMTEDDRGWFNIWHC